MQRLSNEKGSAMIISLVVLLMLGLIGAAAIETSNTDMDIAENYQTDMKSFYIAEAGAELAFTVVRDSLNWRAGFNKYPFAGGEFDVTVLGSDSIPALNDTILLNSTGRRNRAVTILEVKLAPRQPFGWGAHGDDWLRMCGNTMTDSYNSDSGSYATTKLRAGGSVGSNGAVTICGTADIYGDAMTSNPGDLDIKGGALVTGDTSSTAPEINYPPVPQSAFDDAKLNNSAPAGFSGDYIYDPSDYSLHIKPHNTLVLDSGTYYLSDIQVQGSIVIAPGAKVTIYVDGEIDLAAHADINAGGKPSSLLILGGDADFKFSAHSEICAAVYAPEMEFHMNGHANLYGSFIAKTVKDVGGSEFHYDRSLSELSVPGDLVRVAWRELFPL